MRDFTLVRCRMFSANIHRTCNARPFVSKATKKALSYGEDLVYTMLFIGALFSVGHPELVELLDEGALRIHPKARGNAPTGSKKRFCYPIFLKVTIDRTF